MRPDAEGAAFVGGGDEPEQQLGAGVVQRCEAELVDEDEVVAEQGVDDPADGVVGQAAVEGLDEVGGGEVADPVPGLDRGDARARRACGTCRCRPVRSGRRSPRPGPIPGRRGSRRSPVGIEEAATSNSSRVLVTGNAACRSRVRALEASRAAISASTRVRRNSSGFHRWVFAVTSSSGASRRIAAIFSRFNPSVRSAGNGGGVVAVTTTSPPSPVDRGRRPATGSAPSAGSAPAPARPGVGVGAWPLVARIERTSAARHRLNATARSSAASSGSVPWAASRVRISPISVASLVTPAAAAPVRNASATGPNARNAFSAAVLGRAARRGRVRARAAVVVVDDAGLTRRDQRVFGVDLAGDRLDHPQQPSRRRPAP